MAHRDVFDREPICPESEDKRTPIGRHIDAGDSDPTSGAHRTPAAQQSSAVPTTGGSRSWSIMTGALFRLGCKSESCAHLI